MSTSLIGPPATRAPKRASLRVMRNPLLMRSRSWGRAAVPPSEEALKRAHTTKDFHTARNDDRFPDLGRLTTRRGSCTPSTDAERWGRL